MEGVSTYFEHTPGIFGRPKGYSPKPRTLPSNYYFTSGGGVGVVATSSASELSNSGPVVLLLSCLYLMLVR